MKTTVPAKEVEVCDVCHRESTFLSTCLFCGKDYCLVCKGIMAGCIHPVDVCRSCDEDTVLRGIVAKHAPIIKQAIVARDIEIMLAAEHRVQADLKPAAAL